MNELTVRLTIELEDGELIRVGYSAPREQIADAMQPLHTSDNVFDSLLGQHPRDREHISKARQQAAKYITADIADYLVNTVFAKNDTHNGYKKGEV